MFYLSIDSFIRQKSVNTQTHSLTHSFIHSLIHSFIFVFIHLVVRVVLEWAGQESSQEPHSLADIHFCLLHMNTITRRSACTSSTNIANINNNSTNALSKDNIAGTERSTVHTLNDKHNNMKSHHHMVCIHNAS